MAKILKKKTGFYISTQVSIRYFQISKLQSRKTITYMRRYYKSAHNRKWKIFTLQRNKKHSLYNYCFIFIFNIPVYKNSIAFKIKKKQLKNNFCANFKISLFICSQFHHHMNSDSVFKEAYQPTYKSNVYKNAHEE